MTERVALTIIRLWFWVRGIPARRRAAIQERLELRARLWNDYPFLY